MLCTIQPQYTAAEEHTTSKTPLPHHNSGPASAGLEAPQGACLCLPLDLPSRLLHYSPCQDYRGKVATGAERWSEFSKLKLRPADIDIQILSGYIEGGGVGSATRNISIILSSSSISVQNERSWPMQTSFFRTCVGVADPRLSRSKFRTFLINDEPTQSMEPECMIPLVLGC